MQRAFSNEAWGLAQLQEMGFGADECALTLVLHRWDVPAAALALQTARANQAPRPGPSPPRGGDTEAAMCIYGCPLPAYTRRGACCTKCRSPLGPHVHRCDRMLVAMCLSRKADSLPDEE